MDGILNIYKEAGYTSHDVVAKLRGILHIKKIGHTGTLDPDAVGVLPVCIGKATKVCDVLTDRDKTYEAVAVLGITTDTLDVSGNIVTKRSVSVTEKKLRAVLSHFSGEITQIPPMYSAVKVNGKKLYEYAREGKSVERKKRTVTIHEIEYMGGDIFASDPDNDGIKSNLPTFRIRIRCSKGTYIRTLCDDIGKELGCGAAMKSLVRISVGNFAIEDAYRLSEIEDMVSDDNGCKKSLKDAIIPIDEVFSSYSKVRISDRASKRLSNGNPLYPNDMISYTAGDGEIVRVYDVTGENFVALYVYDKVSNRYVVRKFFS